MVAQSKTGFVSPMFRETDDLGKIKDIKVMKRGKSGKVVELDLMTTKGCYRIVKELVIRRVFQKDGISLPSANVVFQKTFDKNGNIIDSNTIKDVFSDASDTQVTYLNIARCLWVKKQKGSSSDCSEYQLP